MPNFSVIVFDSYINSSSRVFDNFHRILGEKIITENFFLSSLLTNKIKQPISTNTVVAKTIPL